VLAAGERRVGAERLGELLQALVSDVHAAGREVQGAV